MPRFRLPRSANGLNGHGGPPVPFPLCLTLSQVAPRRPPGFWQRPRPTCCEAAAWCPKDGLAEAAATAAGGRGGSGSLVPSPLCVRPVPPRSLCLCTFRAPAPLGTGWATAPSSLGIHGGGSWCSTPPPPHLTFPSRPGQGCPQNPQPPPPTTPGFPPGRALTLTQGAARPPVPALPAAFCTLFSQRPWIAPRAAF